MTTNQAKSAIETILNSEAQQKAAAELAAEWQLNLDKAIKSPAGLAGVTMPPREPIMGNWFKMGDLGFICGPRGLGKTWLGVFLARKCAEGPGSMGTLAEWNVFAHRRVLYVDGEMPIDSIRERDSALTIGPAPGMFYLQHEALFHLTGKSLNLADPATQTAILDKCKREKIDIVFLDNQSCLFFGLRENDADSWDDVLPWLLEMRRNRIAVVFIVHSGRNGFMRGSSRREDAAFWIINLSEPKDPMENQHGAKFIARFTKNRNSLDADVPALEWTFFKPPGTPKAQVTWKKLAAQQLFRQCIEQGLTRATEIAQEMGLTPGRVSQLASKAVKEGWLKKKGRIYSIRPTNPISEMIQRDLDRDRELAKTE
ncbi:MAG TPA: AAA family ATPase [Candidatus Sulfotelmatobacter sp.]|nr:AAA family ATPase [Candidatus Sulfotelmatobacter sp.]